MLFNTLLTIHINLPHSAFDNFVINKLYSIINYFQYSIFHRSILGISNFQCIFWCVILISLFFISKILDYKLNDNKINVKRR